MKDKIKYIWETIRFILGLPFLIPALILLVIVRFISGIEVSSANCEEDYY